jgi:hypothetical protein
MPESPTRPPVPNESAARNANVGKRPYSGMFARAALLMPAKPTAAPSSTLPAL